MVRLMRKSNKVEEGTKELLKVLKQDSFKVRRVILGIDGDAHSILLSSFEVLY